MSKKGIFHFTVSSKLVLEHVQGEPTSKALNTDILLSLSPGMDKAVYFDGRGLPRKEAMKPMTATLCAGLATHIKMCEGKGWKTREDHLNEIMSRIREQLEKSGETREGFWED